MRQPSPIIRLYDRLSRKIENGKGLHMSAEDVDWLVLTGAYRSVVAAAEAKSFEEARARVEGWGKHLDDLALLIEARNETPVSNRGPTGE